MNPLLRDVIELNKVGPKSKIALNGLGLYRVCDLLHYYPRSYERIEGLVEIAELVEGKESYIQGQISGVTILRVNGRIMVQCYIEDMTGRIKVIFFNQPYMKGVLQQAETLILKGKLLTKNKRKMFSNPRMIKEEEFETLTQIKLKPIYPLSKQLKLKALSGYVDQCLELMKGQIKDYLPDYVREEYNLASLSYAYEKIHYPITEEDLEIARRRLVFDEFFLFQMAMVRIKEKVQRSLNEFKISKNSVIHLFVKQLPFKLTKAQNRSLEDIFKDFSGEHTMTRLVQGDVGSGKTIVATIGLMATALSGYQSAFMAPTEVLAKQHYNSLSKQFEPYNIHVELLIGSTTAKEKRRIYEKLTTGEIDIIIGTHALIQEKVEFKALAFVITDEQHRFGVMQRESLVSKGRYPHTLVMSATPIPRTLALIVYGDLDISVIDELPLGRKEIETYLVNSSYQDRYLTFIEKEVSAGRNVYVVCPMVKDLEEDEMSEKSIGDKDCCQNQGGRQTIPLKSVESYAEELKDKLNPSIRIGTLHGKMKGKEKTAILEAFLNYEIQVLVSTTVIEVGVNIPNASLMIIENAERFGLAQLHQLRGRVGRSEYQSYCILVSDTKSKETKQKLKFMKEHSNGFDLADYDLKSRGPGDAFGTKQSGIPFFKLADLYDDMDLLKEANKLASNFGGTEELDHQLDMFYYQLEGDIGL